jgi:aspartyl-tRNA(Asn)/glutamyl-tRNA(Gln) amidotransferase subunit A
VAFAAEWAMPTNDPLRAMEHIAFTLPYNMSEQPAISVPCGHNAAACPSACRSSAAGTTTWACCAWRAPWSALRGAQRPWPQPPA